MNPVFLKRICLEIDVGKFLQNFCCFLTKSFYLNTERSCGLLSTTTNVWYPLPSVWQNSVCSLVCTSDCSCVRFVFSEWMCLLLHSQRTQSGMQPGCFSSELPHWITQRSSFSPIQRCDKLLLDLGAQSCKQWGCHWKRSWSVTYREQAAACLPAEEMLDLRNT